MTNEEKKNYIFHLMRDIQHVRSIFYEANGADTIEEKEACDDIGEITQPWLFGKQCLLPALEKLSAADEIDDGTILNLAGIAKRSPMLQAISVRSGRYDPSIEEVKI